MSFLDLDYFIFFTLVFAAWHSQADFRHKKAFLLLASWLFYAAAHPPYLALLLAATTASYALAFRIQAALGLRRRLWLALGLALNLGGLAYFKYAGLFQGLGGRHGAAVLLPIGISFYSFHNISYLVDVYRRSRRALDSFTDYALYIAFFPQLVAGPILRVGEFAPQLMEMRAHPPRPLWGRALGFLSLGLFKKAVLADSLALFIDPVMSAPGHVGGVAAVLALYAYAFQIYLDFSGYTDIAEGCANLLGFRLVENFRAPYLASSPRDFWRRWHMSLSRWLRDYLYIPLGGSRHGWLRSIVALMLTMALGGLWHGASWNFVLWGCFHGCFLAAGRLYDALRPGPRWPPWAGRLLTFHGVLFGWLLFRLPSLEALGAWFSALGHGSASPGGAQVAVLAALVLGCAWMHAWEGRQAARLRSDEGLALPLPVLGAMHAFSALALLARGGLANPFIYFQF